MSKAALLIVVALVACSSSDPLDDAPGGEGAGESGAGGEGASAGTMQAGSGGTSGNAGGTNAGNGGVNAGNGGDGDAGGDGGDSGGTGGTAGTGGDAGPGGDGGHAPDAGEKPDWSELADGDCVVAKRIDQCCYPWSAVTYGEAKADPCLVALGEPITSEEAADCAPPTSECALVDCFEPLAPPSRVALRGDGACMYTDECMTPADCVLARDVTGCCSCSESMPKSLVEQASCLAAEGEGADATCTDKQCLAVLCVECEAPPEPTCAIGDALNRCQ